MKKILLTIAMLTLAVPAFAQVSLTETISKFPAMKQGIAYSIEDSQINYLATIDVIKKAGVNLEIGYAGAAQNTASKAVAVVSYDLVELKKYVNVPILDLISLRPGVYVGIGRIEGFQDGQLKCEGDWGLSLSVIDIKW